MSITGSRRRARITVCESLQIAPTKPLLVAFVELDSARLIQLAKIVRSLRWELADFQLAVLTPSTCTISQHPVLRIPEVREHVRLLEGEQLIADWALSADLLIVEPESTVGNSLCNVSESIQCPIVKLGEKTVSASNDADIIALQILNALTNLGRVHNSASIVGVGSSALALFDSVESEWRQWIAICETRDTQSEIKAA